MKGKQEVLFEPAPDKVGFWLTPKELYKKLDAEFHFTFDACPYPRPPGYDSLIEDWGKSNWVNPPFEGANGKIGLRKWALKAFEESKRGNQSVIILPLPTWFQTLIEGGAEIRSIGRVKWVHPSGKERQSPQPQFLFIIRPSQKTTASNDRGM